ncbi:MAG: (Fe-S)-binding protein [Planctomycetota bacterium]|nr:(Fe-S)-binding protein [Planctomycetota bacterium]
MSQAPVKLPSTLDCITCGLCIPSCPTWQLTGRESQSPRGRVHLMRAHEEDRLPLDGDLVDELEDCLVCRRCESVCPAGVSFGALMEDMRESAIAEGFKLPRKVNLLLGQLNKPRRLSMAMGGVRLLQRIGLSKLDSAMAGLPPIPPASERKALPEWSRAEGTKQGEVWILEGCVMPELYGRVNRAAVRLLQKAGFDVRAPKPKLCCGAMHAHGGQGHEARKLARAWIDLAEDLGWPEAIVSTSAGCGAHMHEFDRVLADDSEYAQRAVRFAALVQDASVFLRSDRAFELISSQLKPLPGDFQPVAYDDPCHLCHAQGVREEPRSLVDSIPDLVRVDLNDPEACCGSAGLYSVMHPEESAKLLEGKLQDFDNTGAQTLVTANPGCQMQWTGGVRAPKRVLHLVELLALSVESKLPT